MKKLLPLLLLFSTLTLQSSAGGCAFTFQPDSINNLSVSFTYMGWNGPLTYSWDFGDALGTSTLQNPSYVYQLAGVYSVTLNTLDTNGIPCNYNLLINVGLGTGCSFISSGTAPIGSPVYFTNTSVGSFVNYQWDFSDSSGSAMQNPSHVFNSVGTFTVCLTTTDAGGMTCMYCENVIITPPTGCAAAFQYTATGLNTYFIENSINTNLPAMNYQWDFGDFGSSASRFPNHIYSAPGSYNVCLIISDGATCADSICQIVSVDTIPPAGCNANFLFTQMQSFSITIVNSSIGAGSNYLWDFGDGSTSNLAYPSHTYTSTGSYFICLSITDSTGCTSNFCDSLNVDSLGNISGVNPIGFTVTIIAPSDLVLSAKEIDNFIMSVYPNPAQEFFVVDVQDPHTQSDFVLHSFTGSTCSTGRLFDGRNVIDLSKLSSGMYFFEVRNEKGERKCWKIVKE